MTRITDALELLTAQHEELAAILERVTTCDADDRALVLAELADKLTTHLAAEQELFYPSLALHAPAEHGGEMTSLVAELMLLSTTEIPSSPLLAELASQLARHATAQEDDLFVTVAEMVPVPELIGLGEELREWTASSLCLQRQQQLAA